MILLPPRVLRHQRSKGRVAPGDCSPGNTRPHTPPYPQPDLSVPLEIGPRWFAVQPQEWIVRYLVRGVLPFVSTFADEWNHGSCPTKVAEPGAGGAR